MPFFLQTTFAASVMAFNVFAANADAAIGPTVKDIVEFTRIVQPANRDNDALRTQVSPDGARAFIVTRRADVRTRRNVFDILLLDLRPDVLSAGLAPAPQPLLSLDAAKDSDDSDASVRDVRWSGNDRLVFRARVQDRPYQAFALEVATRKLTRLTDESLGVVEFAVSDDLRRVVYIAPQPNPAVLPDARSVVVGTHSFWNMHYGQNDLSSQQRRYRLLVADVGSRRAARALGPSFAESSGRWPAVSISPDGRWAVVPRYVPERQIAWSRQYPQVAEATSRFGPSLKRDPLGFYSRPYSYVTRQAIAYRLSDAKAQIVVDAPDDAWPGSNQLRTDRLWRRGGKSVVIAGTYLPAGTAVEPGTERKAHIIEYWPESGTWNDIAAVRHHVVGMSQMNGAAGFVVNDGDLRRRFEPRVDGGWREIEGSDATPTPPSAWTLGVVESLNQPPDIVASGPGDRTVRLTELNRQYAPSTWGVMRPYSWKDAKGQAWDGGLMVPAGFDPKVQHALVIQTYGFSPARFYLDGSNVYDGYTSGFAGRAFLRENILVLALPWGPAAGSPDDEHAALRGFMDGVRGAIDALVRDGIVDPQRVGIMGWSATGERVLNQVTFSDVPIRAATLLDGDANTLFSMTITYAVKDGIQNRKEMTNEGGPFGASLPHWVRNDPSLHTDCIRAALRIETYGSAVRNNWDIYALMRRQYKPVEMIMIPGGSHALARPDERMISLQGNVDWYRFWLNREERADVLVPGETQASLVQQYARWRQLEQLKQDDDAKPACARTAAAE